MAVAYLDDLNPNQRLDLEHGVEAALVRGSRSCMISVNGRRGSLGSLLFKRACTLSWREA
jgi:hypothetical protein